MRLAVPTILVYNKIDVAAPSNRHPDEASFDRVVEVSATTGKGLDDLREGVRAVLSPKATNVGWAVSERQAEALIRARVAADAFLSDAHAGVPIDVLVPHVRDAASALLEITGVRRRARARLGHHGSAETGAWFPLAQVGDRVVLIASSATWVRHLIDFFWSVGLEQTWRHGWRVFFGHQ